MKSLFEQRFLVCPNILSNTCKYGQYEDKKCFNRDRTRTCNPQIRSLVPYPFGHTAPCVLCTSILFYLCQNIICVAMICQTKTTKLSVKEKCCTVDSILQTGKVPI